jgi:Na+-translocating ferredoxin:NAD+ oxidoreductase RnfG subunit
MDGTTGIVLAVLGCLTTIILGILNYSTKKNEREEQQVIKQAELSIKLNSIEKELIEIKKLLVANVEKYETLEKRVFILEQKKEEENK